MSGGAGEGRRADPLRGVVAPVIDVVPMLLAGRRELIYALAAAVGRAFGAATRVRSPGFDPEAAFDPTRGQYSSSLLLASLLADPAGDGGAPAARVLGVAGVDLFIPILTWVYGEAQLGGRAAVVSTHRLRNELYGLAADERLLAARLEKEAIHELGHTYGLVHCTDPACVMRASTYVEEIDLKSVQFCARCRRIVDDGGGTG